MANFFANFDLLQEGVCEYAKVSFFKDSDNPGYKKGGQFVVGGRKAED